MASKLCTLIFFCFAVFDVERYPGHTPPRSLQKLIFVACRSKMAMADIFPFASNIKILVIADVDHPSASLLVEKYVPSGHQIDLILLMGPFAYRECSSPEELALMTGDISAIIAQMENVVCRVCILGSDLDPSDILTEQMHLTPNSVNIHARRISLADNLDLMGFAETTGNLRGYEKPDDEDEHGEDVTPPEDLEVTATTSSVDVIGGLLEEVIVDTKNDTAAAAGAQAGDTTTNSNKGFCLFAFHNRYPTTLNSVLFHMPEKLAEAGVNLLIMPPSVTQFSDEGEGGGNGAAVVLPDKIGKLSIASPGSLRRDGCYCSISLSKGGTGGWDVDSVDHHTL
jgi:hypothetical protein